MSRSTFGCRGLSFLPSRLVSVGNLGFTPRLCHLAFVAVAGLSVLANCGSGTDKPPAGANPLGFAILNSNYKVTSVSLYNAATGELREDCVHSGEALLKQDLSGDVTLPSARQQTGELTVIDSGNAVLTFVDPTTCVPRVQLSVGTGFDSNPHDVVTISSKKAYVTRYNTNMAPTDDPSDNDEGDDLLVIDPSVTDPTKSPVLARVALSNYATSAAGSPLLAHPDRAVLAAGRVYVTLNSFSADFKTTGPGRVVVIDPATDMVTDMIDLSTEKDCSGIQYVAAQKKLYVSCGGAFGDPSQVAQSALVEIDISGTTPVRTRAVLAASFDQAINLFYAAVLGETAFVGTFGTFADVATGTTGTPDRFYAAPIGGGSPTPLFEGVASNLGGAAVDAITKKVLLPDADPVTPRIHVFDASGATVVATEASDFHANPTGGLPPRAVAAY
jgi:hypothetical protein